MLPLVGRVRTFFVHELGKPRPRPPPQPRRTAIKLLKIALLAVRTFTNDQATVRAAALTLYTLLSIVPVTALLFGIAKGFGLDAKLEAWLMTQFAEQQDVMQQTVIMARSALQSTQGGLVAG